MKYLDEIDFHILNWGLAMQVEQKKIARACPDSIPTLLRVQLPANNKERQKMAPEPWPLPLGVEVQDTASVSLAHMAIAGTREVN